MDGRFEEIMLCLVGDIAQLVEEIERQKGIDMAWDDSFNRWMSEVRGTFERINPQFTYNKLGRDAILVSNFMLTMNTNVRLAGTSDAKLEALSEPLYNMAQEMFDRNLSLQEFHQQYQHDESVEIYRQVISDKTYIETFMDVNKMDVPFLHTHASKTSCPEAMVVYLHSAQDTVLGLGNLKDWDEDGNKAASHLLGKCIMFGNCVVLHKNKICRRKKRAVSEEPEHACTVALSFALKKIFDMESDAESLWPHNRKDAENSYWLKAVLDGKAEWDPMRHNIFAHDETCMEFVKMFIELCHRFKKQKMMLKMDGPLGGSSKKCNGLMQAFLYYKFIVQGDMN
eukprot:m51a1_g9866 hypothetical protein (340) ;mRNA; f:64934-67788